jgi:hypothetical protein
MNRTGAGEGSNVMSVMNSGSQIDEVQRGCCWYIRRSPEPIHHASYFAMINNEETRTICNDWGALMTSVGLPGQLSFGEEGTTALTAFARTHSMRSVVNSPGGYGVLIFGEPERTSTWLNTRGENYPKLMSHTFMRYLWSQGRPLPKMYSRLRQAVSEEVCSNWNILRLAKVLCKNDTTPSYGPMNDHPMTWGSVEQFRINMRSSQTQSIQPAFNLNSNLPQLVTQTSFSFAKDTAVYMLIEAYQNRRTITNEMIILACDLFQRTSNAILNIDAAVLAWPDIDDFDYEIKIFNGALVGAWIDMDTFEDVYKVISIY